MRSPLRFTFNLQAQINRNGNQFGSLLLWQHFFSDLGSYSSLRAQADETDEEDNIRCWQRLGKSTNPFFLLCETGREIYLFLPAGRKYFGKLEIPSRPDFGIVDATGILRSDRLGDIVITLWGEGLNTPG